MSSYRLLQGDALTMLRTLPDESVQCCVTSPPYWCLRNYGHAGQMGLEQTPEEYVAGMVSVFREVRRVLRPDGALWLNLGDSYASTGKSGGGAQGRRWADHGGRCEEWGGTFKPAPPGLKPKDLVGIPWRVAFALQADGWTLRSDVIWHKPNAMPESVRDRPTKAHEYVFLLTRGESYFYDVDSIREPHADPRESKNGRGGKNAMRGQAEVRPRGNAQSDTRFYHPLGRNRRSVWTVATQPFKGAHFAVMPAALVEPCILAGSRPGDMVLDPFAGSGTTGVVALGLWRRFLGVELNPDYCAMAEARLRDVAPLFDVGAA